MSFDCFQAQNMWQYACCAFVGLILIAAALAGIYLDLDLQEFWKGVIGWVLLVGLISFSVSMLFLVCCAIADQFRKIRVLMTK